MLDRLGVLLASFRTRCCDCCHFGVKDTLQFLIVGFISQLPDLRLVEQLVHLKGLDQANLVLFGQLLSICNTLIWESV